MCRLADSTSAEFVSARRPFSNFNFVDDRFDGSIPVRRLFTLARARDYKSFIIEDVPATGPVRDENHEIKSLIPAFVDAKIVRVTFWKIEISEEKQLGGAVPDDLTGYALFKRDDVTGRLGSWHTFESVLPGYPHQHNYQPSQLSLEVAVKGRRFLLKGSPYCQQNGLNKACAQVALRTLCSMYLNKPDLTYSEINRIARTVEPLPDPACGLKPIQIEAVLDHYQIPFYSIFYPESPRKSKVRSIINYQKVLYSGIESGAGSLLGFSMGGRRAKKDVGHVIPLYGHTFNQDTWAPVAEGEYFKIGNKIRYISSEAWTSSFLCHDDNFGSNFCLPKSFVTRNRANYVVALRPRGFAYSGLEAEIMASELFYSILPQVPYLTDNRWLERLKHYVSKQRLILRTVPNTAENYSKHLASLRDWENLAESSKAVGILTQRLPKRLWVVEVSIPDLFSTNLRKLGEILLDGTSPNLGKDLAYFVFGRLPGLYVFFDKLDRKNHKRFQFFLSGLKSHTEIQLERANMS